MLFREADGRYSVSAPALKGCHTWGDTIPEALDNAREAITCYLDVLREDGEPISSDSPNLNVDMSESSEAFILKLKVQEAVPVA